MVKFYLEAPRINISPVHKVFQTFGFKYVLACDLFPLTDLYFFYDAKECMYVCTRIYKRIVAVVCLYHAVHFGHDKRP